MMTVQGDKALARAFDELASRRRRVVARSALGKAATIVNKSVKRAVPPDLKQLKKSIGRRTTTYPDSGVVHVAIGPRYDYTAPEGYRPSGSAWDVEFGDAESAARPFARPGLDAARGAALQAIRDGAWAAIKREAERAAAKARVKR